MLNNYNHKWAGNPQHEPTKHYKIREVGKEQKIVDDVIHEREREAFPNIHTILTILIWPPSASHSGSREENWHLIYSHGGKFEIKCKASAWNFSRIEILVRSTPKTKKCLLWQGNPKGEKI